jgi:hypothetical protein
MWCPPIRRIYGGEVPRRGAAAVIGWVLLWKIRSLSLGEFISA